MKRLSRGERRRRTGPHRGSPPDTDRQTITVTSNCLWRWGTEALHGLSCDCSGVGTGVAHMVAHRAASRYASRTNRGEHSGSTTDRVKRSRVNITDRERVVENNAVADPACSDVSLPSFSHSTSALRLTCYTPGYTHSVTHGV